DGLMNCQRDSIQLQRADFLVLGQLRGEFFEVRQFFQVLLGQFEVRVIHQDFVKGVYGLRHLDAKNVGKVCATDLDPQPGCPHRGKPLAEKQPVDRDAPENVRLGGTELIVNVHVLQRNELVICE